MPVAFDTTGMERHDERTWFDPRTGDQVSLTYIGLVPDIPAPLDDLPLLRRKLAEETAETGSIIEAHVVSLDGLPTLFQLIKLPIPGQDTGLAFIAAFTVPRERCSAVLRIQCAEMNMTGLRESTVAAQVGFENCFPPHPYAPDVHGQLPYNVADEPTWDQQFPDHPLTRARAWAHRTLATARLDPRFKALPPFQAPLRHQQAGPPHADPPSRHAAPAEQPNTPSPWTEPPSPHATPPEPAPPNTPPPGEPRAGLPTPPPPDDAEQTVFHDEPLVRPTREAEPAAGTRWTAPDSVVRPAETVSASAQQPDPLFGPPPSSDPSTPAHPPLRQSPPPTEATALRAGDPPAAPADMFFRPVAESDAIPAHPPAPNALTGPEPPEEATSTPPEPAAPPLPPPRPAETGAATEPPTASDRPFHPAPPADATPLAPHPAAPERPARPALPGDAAPTAPEPPARPAPADGLFHPAPPTDTPSATPDPLQPAPPAGTSTGAEPPDSLFHAPPPGPSPTSAYPAAPDPLPRPALPDDAAPTAPEPPARPAPADGLFHPAPPTTPPGEEPPGSPNTPFHPAPTDAAPAAAHRWASDSPHGPTPAARGTERPAPADDLFHPVPPADALPAEAQPAVPDPVRRPTPATRTAPATEPPGDRLFQPVPRAEVARSEASDSLFEPSPSAEAGSAAGEPSAHPAGAASAAARAGAMFGGEASSSGSFASGAGGDGPPGPSEVAATSSGRSAESLGQHVTAGQPVVPGRHAMSHDEVSSARFGASLGSDGPARSTAPVQPSASARPEVAGQTEAPDQHPVPAQPEEPAELDAVARTTEDAPPGKSVQLDEWAQASVQPDMSAHPDALAQPGISGQPETAAQPGISGQPETTAQPGTSVQPEAPARHSAAPVQAATPDLPPVTAEPEGPAQPAAEQSPRAGEPVAEQSVPSAEAAAPARGRRAGVESGDVLQTVLVGLPLAGYLPLWQEGGVTFWRMRDPDAVRARLGAGVETRSEVDSRRYREAAMFSPSRGTLFLMDRVRDESGHLGGTSTQLEPATEEEAYAAVDDKAISELYAWLGEVALASVRRGEFVAVESGGWDVPLRPVVLIMLRTDGREWHSVVETSPVPVGAPVWRDQQPVEGDTQVLASPATDQTVRASGLLTRFAVATWGMHPFQLGLSFGPNPTL